jgi:hypothetical protein
LTQVRACQRGDGSPDRLDVEREGVRMNDVDALRRLARYSVGLAIVLAVPSSIALFGAFGWDIEAAIFGDPAVILSRGLEAAPLLRWAAILDMLFSYILLAPLALFLHRRLRPIRPWLADLGTVGAFAYIVVGAAAAAMLAIVGSSLLEAHATAAPGDRAAIATSFEMLRNIVFFALWQMLDAITAGTWIFCVGWLLLMERPMLGRLLVVLGLAIAGLSVPTMLGIHSLAVLLAGFAVALAVWAGWVALDRGRTES